MKFSEMWLREWVNPPINNSELINQLTMIGFNVEESTAFSNKFYEVVIGEITQCKIHPNFNKIKIIKVNNGSKKLINIICNDIDCQKNLKVVVANTGTLLPNGKIADPIVTAEGNKSEGILCTFSMLGLNDYTEEIVKLPKDAPIGRNFYDYLNFNDHIIDITVTPNRGDCLSIIGIAREIAVINQLRIKKPKTNKIQPNITDTVHIIVEDSVACPQFLGKILKNVNTAIPTPLKIQERLRRCGIHPINIVADITNYVLLELGHPVHAFDYEKIDQNTIYVRFSKLGETLMLSDNNINIELFENTLIIADHKKPLSIAGIIVGSLSNISKDTRHIFLQSAFFNPKYIAGKSRLYNLYTCSSMRYERGIDPNISELALNYVTSLLLSICNGSSGPTTKIVNRYNLPKSNTIILNRIKLNKILGFNITNRKVTYILKNLGFIVKFKNTFWEILTPSWRFDISIEENLISEIIRIYGYSNIPQIPANVYLQKSHDPDINETISLSRAKTILVNRGYQEVITYSFVDPDIQKLLHPNYIPLTIINPINSDMSVMRLSLWPGLIKAVIYNQNRQQRYIRLFESGICFFLNKDETNNQIFQKLMIAGIRSESRYNEHWYEIKSPVDFYDIKGDIESLLSINKTLNKNIVFKNCTHSALHPKKSASIYSDNIHIGYIGMIHPIIQSKLNLYVDTLIFELSWNAISKFTFPKVNSISKFPKNYRDLSLIIPSYVFAADVINACKKMNINQLINIKLVDVYTGSNILKGYKSFTIRFVLQGKTHTLQEQEILKIINIYSTMLKKQFHAILR